MLVKFTHRILAIASITIGVASIALAPAGAAVASTNSPGTAHAPRTAVQPDFTIGVKYQIKDLLGEPVTWNGKLRGQLNLAPSSRTYFRPIHSKKVRVDGLDRVFYQWQINGGKDCLENRNGDVVADTCVTSRTSQWWWYDTAGYFDYLYNLAPIKKELPFMWADGNAQHRLYLKTLEPLTFLDEWSFSKYK
jgi:hypothetical protein